MPNQATRQRLLQRRQILIARYEADVERDLEVTLADASGPWTMRGLVLRACDTRALAEVIGALRRLDRGRYGICVTCSQPITKSRLAALPATATCYRCAASNGSAVFV